MVLALVVACSESPPIRFGAFEKVKAAALERGCVERIGTERTRTPDPQQSEYFECERVVGPRCDCRITFSIERQMSRSSASVRDRGISRLALLNEYCPRATAGSIAFTLIAAAVPEQYHRSLEAALVDSPARLERDTEVTAHLRLGGIDLYVQRRMVSLMDGDVPLAPEQAEHSLTTVLPRGLPPTPSPPAFRLLPSSASWRRPVCPLVDLEKRRERQEAERPVAPIELPFQGPVVR